MCLSELAGEDPPSMEAGPSNQLESWKENFNELVSYLEVSSLPRTSELQACWPYNSRTYIWALSLGI